MYASVAVWFSEIKSDLGVLPVVGLGLVVCGPSLHTPPLHSRQLLNMSSSESPA